MQTTVFEQQKNYLKIKKKNTPKLVIAGIEAQGLLVYTITQYGSKLPSFKILF